MKNRCLIAVAATVAALVGHAKGPSLPEAVHDRGGVSFDFAKLSAERHPAPYPKVGKNILANPWCGTYTNGEERVIALPHARGGRFRIAALTKVKPLDVAAPVRDTAIMIRIGNVKDKGRFVETPKRGEYVWNGFVKRGRDWNVATKAFDVRPGETHALVMFKCESARIEIKDVVLCEEVPQPEDAEKPEDKAPLTIKAEFCNYIDGGFQVSEGQVGELAFSFAKSGTYDHGRGTFSLTLPAGIDFVDATFARTGTVKTERRADGSSVTTFAPNARFRPGAAAYWWAAQHVLVRATRGVGPCGDGGLAYRLDGTVPVTAESMKIRFSIGPRIVGAQPKAYGCGGWQLGAYEFDNAASAEELARFHQTCGQNWIIPSAAEEYPYLGIWRACGFRYVTPQSGTWCRNGYELVLRGTEAPEDLRMVATGDSDVRHAKNYAIALCPLAITGDSDYVRNECLKRIADNVKGVDGMWSNWEPYMYCGKGCACLRCGKAFARFVGKDWAAISNDWPKCAFPGGALAKRGVEFRSRCHADVVRKLDEVVRAVTGKDSIGFLPGIHFGQMTSSWRDHHPMPEASPEHYAADIPWINLWGPYVPWRTKNRYFKERARHVAQFVCAKDLREQIAADYPPERRPRILASPQGTCGDYFTQPEAFEMNFDAYFFNRFAGCCPWVFPIGADARYWRAFANASVRAARYEDAVFGGVPADDRVRIETVPEYAAPVERIMRYVEKWRKVPQILSTAYDHEGARIVAVFNCWQLGEAFFTLKAEGLPAGDYRIVSDDGVLWSRERGDPAYSAEELAKGVFLSVGSCRTRVFEIVPADRPTLTAPRSERTAERLRSIYAERRPALAEAARQDALDAEDDVFGITRCD